MLLLPAYNERYAGMPKYIISAAGDEFFMLDDSNYYYDQLEGPTFLRFVQITITIFRE